jgi:type IV pilus assembly protein PilM
VREIPFGSKGVTQSLQKMKSLPEPEAELFKESKDPAHAPDLKAALHEGLDPLADEIRHSIDFFENETGEELKTIWLSGGGALCPGAPEALSEDIGRRVVLWDNTKKMDVFGDIDRKFLSEHSAELNVALGMALRGTSK